MLRSRNLLGYIFKKKGLLLESFYVLRQGLQNFKLFAEGCTKGIETGLEAKEKGSFALPELFGGQSANPAANLKGGQPGKAPAKAPEKVPPAKGAPAGKGKDALPDEDALAKEEEERKKKLVIERERLRVQTEMQAKRRHPHMLLWLKLKMELIRILMAQNRIEDVADCISIMKIESLTVKDTYFTRRVNQIEFMLLVQSGEIQKALNKGYEIINYSKKYGHDDKDMSEFLGLFGEFLYNVDKRDEAVELLRQGRMDFWIKARNNGVEIVPTDINLRGEVMVNADRKKVTEEAIG